MTIETERMVELHNKLTEITTELNSLDQYNTKNRVRVLKLLKEFKKIEKEGKELLKQQNQYI